MAVQAHGYASLNGGTTGGAGGASVTVSTGKELLEAITRSGVTPLTIYVDGEITPENTGSDIITLKNVHNLSIIGAGDGAEFDGIGFQVKGGSSNLIFQNLKIHSVHGGEGDAIGLENGVHNVWIDHNEFYDAQGVDKDYFDGLVDTKKGVEYVTVSNNYFHDHYKVSLNGFTDTDTGGRYLTFNNNYFEDIGSRAPSVRGGHVHVYNNVYKNVESSGVNLRMGAEGLIENNVFEDVKDLIVSIDSKQIGYWNLRGNQFTDVSWSKLGKNEANAADGRSTTDFDVPYDYTLAATPGVKSQVVTDAGLLKRDVLPIVDEDIPPGTGGNAGDGTLVEDHPAESVIPTPVEGDPTELVGTGKADMITGTSRSETIDGLGGADVLLGNGGNDTLNGGTNDDSLDGGSGNDTLLGENGKDLLDGGPGHDRLDGGASNDVLLGGPGKDVMLGSDGNDSLDGGADDDDMDGGDGTDALLGGAGNDLVKGGAGKDTLTGGNGDDRLIGGLDSDQMIGNEGNDTFVLTQLLDSRVGSGRDVIVDFTKGDRINLSAIDASSKAGGDQAFAFMGSADFTGKAGELHAILAGDDTLIEGDVNGDAKADFQIELPGIHTLAASDFIL